MRAIDSAIMCVIGVGSRWFLIVLALAFLTPTSVAAAEQQALYPIIDCTVVTAHGAFGAYGGPGAADRITLDLNAPEKWELSFRSERPGPSYIPSHAAFSLIKHDNRHKIIWEKFRFISEAADEAGKVTVDVTISGEARLNGVRIGDGTISMWIHSETDQSMDGLAILQCQIAKRP